jgi:hypothetical protein
MGLRDPSLRLKNGSVQDDSSGMSTSNDISTLSGHDYNRVTTRFAGVVKPFWLVCGLIRRRILHRGAIHEFFPFCDHCHRFCLPGE